ncbi:hypothetical protein FRB93_011705 [Tulasnella sp. JGI-2019a]|nr:hypothetical protein FRB93_011705 [Tulasnella sp. JGI-2019a]
MVRFSALTTTARPGKSLHASKSRETLKQNFPIVCDDKFRFNSKLEIDPDEFWVALREHCVDLRELHVKCMIECDRCPLTSTLQQDWTPSKLFKLGGLRPLILKLGSVISTTDPERLKLDVTLLAVCPLPRLRHLFLDRPHFEQGLAFCEFLETHPTLRTLSIPYATFPCYAEQQEVFASISRSLPNLWNLRGGFGVVGGLLSPLPTGGLRPLVYVNLVDEPQGLEAELHEARTGRPADDISHFPTLRSLSLGTHLVTQQLTPRLDGCKNICRMEIVCLGWSIWAEDENSSIVNRLVSNLSEWTNWIWRFGNLEVLVMDAGLALALRFLSVEEAFRCLESSNGCPSSNTIDDLLQAQGCSALASGLSKIPHDRDNIRCWLYHQNRSSHAEGHNPVDLGVSYERTWVLNDDLSGDGSNEKRLSGIKYIRVDQRFSLCMLLTLVLRFNLLCDVSPV